MDNKDNKTGKILLYWSAVSPSRWSTKDSNMKEFKSGAVTIKKG